MKGRRRARSSFRRRPRWLAESRPESRRLYKATDHGQPMELAVEDFTPSSSREWDPYVDAFLRFNELALGALDVRPEVTTRAGKMAVRLWPGEVAGAIPLKTGVNGRVAGGLLVEPRFGWDGIGSVLHHTGWRASPQFPDLAMVPGSAREVPPWVLAGPVLVRLEALLRALTPGFIHAEELLSKPRGRILWSRYLHESLAHGQWHHVPCRFPSLDLDPLLRRYVRWALERLHADLVSAGEQDVFALALAAVATRLIGLLADSRPLMPRRDELDRYLSSRCFSSAHLRLGVEAIGWIAEERGLGGGRERDGLAWTLPLSQLWEDYVEAVYREEVAREGGVIKVGRLGETLFPLDWTDSTHRTLGQLVPDIVVRKGTAVHIVDAKYKAHLAEVDEAGWREFEQHTREAHRADLHQVLAYAALYDSEEITATLVYPLRLGTYLRLHERGRDRSFAELQHGGRRLRLELRGLPFGSEHFPIWSATGSTLEQME